MYTGEASNIVEGFFKFTKEQINTLKQKVMSQDDKSNIYTTYEVLAGHTWRTACKARGLTYDQDVQLNIPSDGRKTLNDPPLPKGYCGNVIFITACLAKAGDIMHKPLFYTIEKIHQTVKRVKTSEYMRSAIDYLESQPDLTTMVRGAHSSTCPNLTINSWSKFNFNQLDFGWGGPSIVRISGVKYEGQSYLIASQNGDGSISLAIKLYSVHMALFEKYIYEF